MSFELTTLKTKALLRKRKRKQEARDEAVQLTPFIQQLFALDDIREKSNPAHLSELAFSLYQRQREDIVQIKDEPVDKALKKRFQHFLSEVHTGFSPLSARNGLDILNASNSFLAMTAEMDDSGLDIGSHFRMSSSFSKKGRILYNAVKVFRPKTLLEIGTAYGMSALFLLAAAERYAADSVLHTVEAGEPQYSIASRALEKRFSDQVRCHKGLSTTVLPDVVAGCDTIDFVFHDGAHDGETYQTDFRNLMPALRPGTVVVFDDIHWFDKRFVSTDPGCYNGWRSVVERPEVRCAVEISRDIGVALIVPSTETA